MTGLMVRVRCPNLRCRAVLSVSADKRGRCVRCEMCGQSLMIPLPAASRPRPRPAESVEHGNG